VGDIEFKVISAAENSNKFQKTRFWKEKSVENLVTLGPTAQATLVMILKPLKTAYFCSFIYLYFAKSNSEACLINKVVSCCF
jgi:hypothetical protein